MPGTNPNIVTINPTNITEVYSSESKARRDANAESFKRSNAKWSIITPARGKQSKMFWIKKINKNRMLKNTNNSWNNVY